jgi:hypothetical protein
VFWLICCLVDGSRLQHLQQLGPSESAHFHLAVVNLRCASSA